MSPSCTAETGQVLELGEGAKLTVLVAGERGAVFLLEWGNFRALLPIGITFEDLEALDYGQPDRSGDSPAAGRSGLCSFKPAGVDRSPAPAGTAVERGSRGQGWETGSRNIRGGPGLYLAAH